MRAEMAVGVRYVTGHRVLRALALAIALSYLFGITANSILILFLVSERHMSPALIGLAFTIGSVGVIVGALVTSRLTKRLGVGPRSSSRPSGRAWRGSSSPSLRTHCFSPASPERSSRCRSSGSSRTSTR